MNYFEYLMSQHDLYEEIARIYAFDGEPALAQFYYNSALGYKIRAEKLTVQALLDDKYKY